MNWNYGTEQPDIFSKNIKLGQQIATINCFISQTEDGFKWSSYTLPPNVLDYDSINNVIISSEYPSDRMQAIINNYLLDPTDTTIKQEFDDMQAFRTKAKAEAHTILDYIDDNNLWAR